MKSTPMYTNEKHSSPKVQEKQNTRENKIVRYEGSESSIWECIYN